MSASGRFVAMRRPGTIEIVDVLGTAPRSTVPLDEGDFAIAGTTLCVLDSGGLRSLPLEGTSRGGQMAAEMGQLRVFHGRSADAALIDDRLVALTPDLALVTALGTHAQHFPLLGRAVIAAAGHRISLVTPTRATVDLTLATGGDLLDAAPVFGGRLIALLVRELDDDVVIVVTAAGQHVHRIRLPVSAWHAFAIDRGQLLLGPGDSELVAVDLRYGRILGYGSAPHDIAELVMDDDGRSAALASPAHGAPPSVSLVQVDDILRAKAASVVAETTAREPEPDAVIARAPDPPQAIAIAAVDAVSMARDASIAAAAPEAPVLEVPGDPPLAFGAVIPRIRVLARGTAAPFADGAQHLTALLDLIAARAAMAIAEGWHTGRISSDGLGQHPFEREVLALAGAGGGHASDLLAQARTRVAERAEVVASRVEASLASNIALPFVELAHEFQLSPIATQILLAVLAPRARGELGRLYRILGNETQRPTCDDALVALLLASDDAGARDRLVAELAQGAPLVRHGLVLRDPRGGLDVDDAVLARLRGQAPTRSTTTSYRRGDCHLDDLIVDRRVLRALVLELAEPRPDDAPLRLVLRARRGAGRHTIIAALAARVDRTIACIDASQLAGSAAHAEVLRRELFRAALSRAVPIVSGLELGDGADREATQLVRQVLRAHPGPIVVRTSPNAAVPLDAGYLDFEIPALTETERYEALARVFAASHVAADAAAIAHRYRVGPGTIARITREARRRLDRSGGDPTSVVDDVARQHVAARAGAAAQRVTRLASWDQVALPEDMLDSLRELIGRARHSRTVFEDWGYDRRITSSRGLTALFYGPPGTGKTMVAGLIARELGLELYRVDLAKVMSKWLGETEKNLGEIFDAAEDGRLMLLFDEADSLFAKRSEVKSSNDRYANLEVNYLLQRLDAFEGVAVLTTNLEGSIDPAFKRRLSMRLYFPFPDEDIRTQLWATHVTPQIPTVGTIDFAALARRFPLSGGYIRNSVLRAAFLAAQENEPLSQAHLERAVLLEYRELGKLAEGSRME